MTELEPDAAVAAWADALVARRHVPAATYRLQLHAGFPFQAARDLVPYLDELGIGDCYVSPILKARPGSMHGYDVCDHGALNSDLGSPGQFEAFSDALIEYSGNRYAADLLQRMRNVLSLIANVSQVAPGRRARSIEEHRAILDAIRAGDPKAAAKATRAHLDSIEADSLQALEQVSSATG